MFRRKWIQAVNAAWSWVITCGFRKWHVRRIGQWVGDTISRSHVRPIYGDRPSYQNFVYSLFNLLHRCFVPDDPHPAEPCLVWAKKTDRQKTYGSANIIVWAG